MGEDEVPPKRIWLDEERLGEFFKSVRERRKREMDPKGPGPIEDPVENDAASMLIVE